MDFEYLSHHARRARAGDATFRRNAEIRDILPRYVHSLPRPGNAIARMDETKVELGVGRQREAAQRCKEGIIRTLDWHRHVNPLDRPLHARNDEIGELNHLRRVARLDEMLAVEIAIAKVEAELDRRWNRRGEPRECLGEDLLHP